MVDIDTFEKMVEYEVELLPKCFFKELSGGVLIIEPAKRHPEGQGDDLFILGEYERSWSTGQKIYIYYGSFKKIYGHLGKEALQDQIRHTVRHEFRHHIENLAGERGLEIEDEIQIKKYLESKR